MPGRKLRKPPRETGRSRPGIGAADGDLDGLLRATRSLRIDVDLPATLQRIVSEAVNLSGVGDVAVSLVERSTGALSVAAASTPAAGQSTWEGACAQHVVASGEPLLARAEGDGTLLGLPMKAHDHLLGVLTFRTPGSRDHGAQILASL